MKELIIIGGGAAGITAGIYSARKFINTTLITKDFTGQIGVSAWIENYTGFKKIPGLDLIKNFQEHLKMFEIEIKSFENVERIIKIKNGFKIITDENEYKAKSLIIATGSMPKKLNAENEDKFLGKGLSYCVTCDETAFKNKIVAVIGGGNAGAEAVIELSRFCKKVILLEYLNNLGADKILQMEMKNNRRIKVITSADVKSFDGKNNLEKIIYYDLKNKKTRKISVEGCFIEIGAIPNTRFIKNFVNLNKKGEIVVNPVTLETNIKGVFAAGDVTDIRDKQVVIATGEGAKAALSAYNYLKK